jgi:O-antigen/teichoic acid export membrane protein
VNAIDSTLVRAECAPVSGWRRLAVDALLVGGSTMACHVLGAAASLLLRSLLDPAQMGVWQGLRVLLGYANYANLGVSKAATRDLSIALGRGDTASAQRGLDLAHTVNTLSSLVYALGLAAAAWWHIQSQGAASWQPWGLGLLVIAGLAMLQRSVTFRVSILRSRQAFGLASELALLEAALTLSVVGAAAWLWGLNGVYAGTTLVMLASLIYLRRQSGALRWAWDTRAIFRLIADGGPLLLAGIAWSVFASLDKLMILGYLHEGAHELGCYSAALLVTAQLNGLGNMLSVTIAPRFGELWGRTGSRRDVARLVARVSEIQAAAMVLPAGVAIVAAPPILAWLLPEYRSGLAAIAWLVPGAMASCLALPPSQYLMAIEGGRKVLVGLGLGIAIAAVGNHVALTSGGGTIGVAAATTAANGACFLLLVALSIWRDLAAADRRRYAAALGLLLVPTLGVALGLSAGSDLARASWPHVLANSLVVLLVWGTTAALGWHYGGWRDIMRKRS